MKVYRIGKDLDEQRRRRVPLLRQQHAREWVTPITCVETAERLVRNYATDPTTKEYVDKLNIFILPSVGIRTAAITRSTTAACSART